MNGDTLTELPCCPLLKDSAIYFMSIIQSIGNQYFIMQYLYSQLPHCFNLLRGPFTDTIYCKMLIDRQMDRWIDG